VFDFPRVVGNSQQRRPWHPTQLNEELVEPCIRLTTAPGEPVLDPFAGTGTALRVCKRTGNPCTLIEFDPGYCRKIADEHDLLPAFSVGQWEAEGSPSA
jgi:DNA modification methylase